MKSNLFYHRLAFFILLMALMEPLARARAADTNFIRLAIGPFFAPAENTTLAKAAATMPDLLTASLSEQNRFQLVEREKVSELWNELHLSTSGLTSASTVINLGRVLACDWLLSGSFAAAGTNTQIWVKIIDTQSGVLLDLEPVPYQPSDFSATTRAIGDLLANARSRSRPREFIAVGKFQDQSVSTTREDWAPRLTALIEKQFLAAGYGVVEREAVAPIFSEYQFQAAGLTGNSTNRLKLMPAFWAVDGGCKWFRDTEDKLSVTLRIQKMGGREELFSLAKPPGEELEKAVVEAIRSALAGTGSTTTAQALAGESQIRSAQLDDLAKGRGEMPVIHYSTNQTFITVTNPSGGTRRVQVDPAFLAQQQNHAQEMLKTLQQALLLNPNDLKAKWMLGMSWFCSADAGERKQGQDMLTELSVAGDSPYATKAKNWLADFKSGKLTLEPDLLGNPAIVNHGQPASLILTGKKPTVPATARAAAPVTNADAAASDGLDRKTLSGFPPTARFDGGITVAKLCGRDIYIAANTRLYIYNLDSQSAQEISLPMKFQKPISAIEVTDGILWLGTDQGLMRVSIKDGSSRLFTEKDGLPSKSITTLRLVGRRLFMGVGFQNGGAFGYMDLATEHFTGLMNPASVQTSWTQAVQNAPAVPIYSIDTADGNSIWVSTARAIQHLDLASQKWSLATSGNLQQVNSLDGRRIGLNAKYLAMPDPDGGVAISHLPGTGWTNAMLAKDYDECAAAGIATDPANPDHLWVGGSRGKITLVDLATTKILTKYLVPDVGSTDWLLVTADKVVAIIDTKVSGSYSVFCLDKGVLDGSKAVPTPPIAQAATPQPVGDLRNQFLQRNFSKFVPVQFQKDADGGARLQRLDVKANVFQSGDSHYCGFKFTVPQWLDGDFVLLNTIAKSEAQKDFTADHLEVELLSKNGRAIKFDELSAKHIANCPRLKQQLPYTRVAFTRALYGSALEPGKTYAVWFEFLEADFPDIAFAITVDSPRGKSELGTLPVCDSADSSVIIRTPPASAEELRSAVEKAVKAEDTAALKSLVCWQGTTGQTKTGMQNNFELILDYPNPTVKIEPMPTFPQINEVNGIHSRPNVPILGMIKVQSGVAYHSLGLPFGQIGNGFYISVTIYEPVTK